MVCDICRPFTNTTLELYYYCFLWGNKHKNGCTVTTFFGHSHCKCYILFHSCDSVFCILIIGQKSLNLPQNQAYGRDPGFYMEKP